MSTNTVSIALSFPGLAAVEIVSIAVTVLFIVGIAIIVAKTGWLRVRMARVSDVVFKKDQAREQTEKSWGEVERHFFSGSESDLKIAVIKADTLLGDALREAGIRGLDLGERLRKLTAEDLPNLDLVWEAHRLRNRIAHEANFALKRDLAERALTVYEDALTRLGFLKEVPAPKEPENRSPQSP